MLIDQSPADAVELGRGHIAGMERDKIFPQPGWMDIVPSMVRPHQRIFHAAANRRLKESVSKRTFQEKMIFIIIPVEQENPDPAVGGKVNLL